MRAYKEPTWKWIQSVHIYFVCWILRNFLSDPAILSIVYIYILILISINERPLLFFSVVSCLFIFVIASFLFISYTILVVCYRLISGSNVAKIFTKQKCLNNKSFRWMQMVSGWQMVWVCVCVCVASEDEWINEWIKWVKMYHLFYLDVSFHDHRLAISSANILHPKNCSR